MQSKFFRDKYDSRIDAFIDTILYCKGRLSSIKEAIQLAEKSKKNLGWIKRRKLTKHLNFLYEKEIDYQRDLDSAERGIRTVLSDKQRDMKVLEERAKSMGISMSRAISELDENYEAAGIVESPKYFVTPSDFPRMEKPHLREHEEANICAYLISQGYSVERATQLSTGPWVEVALSEIERIIKKEK